MRPDSPEAAMWVMEPSSATKNGSDSLSGGAGSDIEMGDDDETEIESG